MTVPAPPPWERQPGESTRAFLGFATYRDLGAARSLVEAARALGRNRVTLSDWSITHGWVARTDAWDAEQDRVVRAAQTAEVKRMAERHARQAQLAQQAAMAPLQAVLERIAAERRDNDGRSPFLELMLSGDPADALELALSAATRLPALQQAERLARGEPTEIVAQAVVDLTPAGADDLAAVWEALSRAGLVPPPMEAIEAEEI